jgi:8-hydroxy-5-deazaflavin:NADPH oxidoreductase
VISNSQGPDTLTGLVRDLGPRARAATTAQAAAAGDFAIVAIPITAIDQVPVEPLAGKVVMATVNYFPGRLGHIAEIDNGTTTAPGLLQAHLPTSKVVRAFSMIDAADMSGDGHPAGDPKRRALALSGDDPRPNSWLPASTTSLASTRWTSAASTRAGGWTPASPRSSPARTWPS